MAQVRGRVERGGCGGGTWRRVRGRRAGALVIEPAPHRRPGVYISDATPPCTQRIRAMEGGTAKAEYEMGGEGAMDTGESG